MTTILSANGDYKESRCTREYIIGGTPNTSTDCEGDQFTTIVNWEGDSLIFETVEKEKVATLTTREVWMLSADRKELTKKGHRLGGWGDSDQMYVLEKRR